MSAGQAARWAGATVAGLLATAASGEALVPLVAREPQPWFEFYPDSNGTGRVFILHHGHETDGSKFTVIQVLTYLQTQGAVLVCHDGIRPQQTPRATMRMLSLLGLLDREICVYGLSMGCKTMLRTMRLFRQVTGRSIPLAIWESGPYDAWSVDWPLSRAPVIVRILKGGPTTRLLLWAASKVSDTDADYLRAARDNPVYQLACANMVVTGVPSPAEFMDTAVLALVAGKDPRIHDDFRLVAPCFGQSERVVLEDAGHAMPHKDRVPAIATWLYEHSPAALPA